MPYAIRHAADMLLRVCYAAITPAAFSPLLRFERCLKIYIALRYYCLLMPLFCCFDRDIALRH